MIVDHIGQVVGWHTVAFKQYLIVKYSGVYLQVASNQISDYALSYGIGAGVALKLSGPLHFIIDLRYLFGNEAEYINAGREGSIETVGGDRSGPARTRLRPSRTETDVMTIVFGLSLR